MDSLQPAALLITSKQLLHVQSTCLFCKTEPESSSVLQDDLRERPLDQKQSLGVKEKKSVLQSSSEVLVLYFPPLQSLVTVESHVLLSFPSLGLKIEPECCENVINITNIR